MLRHVASRDHLPLTTYHLLTYHLPLTTWPLVTQTNGRRQFGSMDVSRTLLKEMPFSEALTLWLHLNNEDGGIPLMKTLEAQTDEAEAQYRA